MCSNSWLRDTGAEKHGKNNFRGATRDTNYFRGATRDTNYFRGETRDTNYDETRNTNYVRAGTRETNYFMRGASTCTRSSSTSRRRRPSRQPWI